MTKKETFWTDSSFEPKQSFKFKLLFEFAEDNNNIILEIPYYYVVSVDKPKYQLRERVSRLLNEQKKFPTNVTWLPVEIVFVDTVDNRLMSYFSKFINDRNDRNGNTSFRLDQYNKDSFKRSPTVADVLLNEVRIQQLKNEDTFTRDGKSQLIEEWTLHSPWISSFSISQASYSNENLSTYSFTVLYNWATIEYYNNIPQTLTTSEIAESATTVAQIDGTRTGRSINQPLDFSDVLIKKGENISDSYYPTVIRGNEYRSLIERGKMGARVFSLDESMTLEDLEFQTDQTGRRILTTGTPK